MEDFCFSSRMIAQRQSLHQTIDLNTVPHPVCSVFDDNDPPGDQEIDDMRRDRHIAQGLDNNNHHYSSSVSDCESIVRGSGSSSSSNDSRREFFGSTNLMIRVDEEDRVHGVVKQRFLSRLREVDLSSQMEVVAIHRRNWLISSTQAKLISFQIYAQALARKHGGETNMKYAWFGTSKQGVKRIISHGFGHEEITRGFGALYGQGVYLSSDESPLESVQSSAVDEDGLRHLLLCRVLLGKTEAVNLSPGQTYTSSEEFDSGVDSVESPKKYIVWSSHMNTHILPEFVVSFRASSVLPEAMTTTPNTMPRSPFMSFPALIAVLTRILPTEAMRLISNKHKEFKERRVTRDELVRIIRQLAGDKLLKTVIKSCKAKGFPMKQNQWQRMKDDGHWHRFGE